MRNSNGASTLDVPATGDVQAAARRRPLRSAQTSTQIAAAKVSVAAIDRAARLWQSYLRRRNAARDPKRK